MAPARVLLYQVLNSLLLKEVSLTSSSCQQCVAHEGLHVTPQPVTDWHAETHLAPVQVLNRHQRFEGTLQKILRGQSAQFEIFRQAGREFYDVVIQKRRARFE